MTTNDNAETLCPTCRGAGETIQGDRCHDCDASGLIECTYAADLDDHEAYKYWRDGE